MVFLEGKLPTPHSNKAVNKITVKKKGPKILFQKKFKKIKRENFT